MATYAVTYVYAPGTGAALATHRPAHREFLGKLHEQGQLRISGPVDAGRRGLLVLDGESADEVAIVLDEDPFRVEGLIAERTVHEWEIVSAPWPEDDDPVG
jgi:uncharacterized protein YciI